MEIGVFRISFLLIALVAGGAIAWALLRVRYIPQAVTRLQVARGADIPAASSHVVLLRSLSSLALSLVFSPLAVVFFYSYAQWRIETEAIDEKVQSLIQARGFLETVLQPLTAMSFGTWVTALLVIAAIWLAIRGARSRRSWMRALEARRRAHIASVSSLSDDEVFAEAQQRDPRGMAELRSTIEDIESRNRAKIEEAEAAPMFTLGGNDQQPMSLIDLRTLIDELEAHAASLEEAAVHSQAAAGNQP